jgi:hypothetical protein
MWMHRHALAFNTGSMTSDPSIGSLACPEYKLMLVAERAGGKSVANGHNYFILNLYLEELERHCVFPFENVSSSNSTQ